jgi:acetyl-CoA/propionyl-CoA carboxylase biotin carboxyl carrier protein
MSRRVHGESAGADSLASSVLRSPNSRPRRAERKASGGGGGDTLSSPLQGNVFKVLVEQGAQVEEGALICIIEAMKMENEITAHKSGTIAELPIAEGGSVTTGDTLAVITT